MNTLTTLIPAYKPEFLGEALLSLRRQSFRDFRVILSDDSPGEVITQMLRDGSFGPVGSELELLVVRGPGNARLNHQQLLDLWRGQSPLVHFMLDDDVVFPSFYATHVDAHRGGQYAASVSRRWLSQTDSRPAWELPVPDFVSNSEKRVTTVHPEQLFATTAAMCANWLGELSNIVFTAQGASRFPRPPRDGLSFYGLLDIGALLEAGGDLPLAFIQDHLGVFRQHPQQTTHSVGAHGHRVAMLCWAAYALHAWDQGRLTPAQTVQATMITVKRCLEAYGEDDPIMNHFFDIVQAHGASLRELHTAFSRFWLATLASHPATAPSPQMAAPTRSPLVEAPVTA